MNSSGLATPSVLFISFHKCATTLFSEYVLSHIDGLQQVDYATQIYLNQAPQEITFEPEGYVYGVIRIFFSPGSPVYENLVKPVLAPGFIEDKTAIFWVRDPRDILVSEYYSFGFTHGYSDNPAIRQMQENRRAEVAEQSLNEYVIAAVPKIQQRFNAVADLADRCQRGVILQYEDLVENSDRLFHALTPFFTLNESVKAEIVARSRPRSTEDLTAHRRSGQVGGYRTKLSAAAIAQLNTLLAPTLERFGYGDE